MEIVLVFIQNIPKRVCGISILATMPIIFFTSSSIYSQVNPDSFKKDTILLGEKNYIQSEYNIQKDSIFLRNAKIGKIVPKSKVKDIVSDEYFTKIKDTSRLAAISESFYLFSSGREYQWNGEKDSSYEEGFTRALKIGLIFVTAYFYVSSLKANQEIGASFLGFGSERAESRFNREYTSYKIAGGLTAAVFGLSSLKTYFRFGRNSDYQNLNIKDREKVELESIGINQSEHLKQAYLGITILF